VTAHMPTVNQRVVADVPNAQTNPPRFKARGGDRQSIAPNAESCTSG